jgi:hypothetical protein
LAAATGAALAEEKLVASYDDLLRKLTAPPNCHAGGSLQA